MTKAQLLIVERDVMQFFEDQGGCFNVMEENYQCTVFLENEAPVLLTDGLENIITNIAATQLDDWPIGGEVTGATKHQQMLIYFNQRQKELTKMVDGLKGRFLHVI